MREFLIGSVCGGIAVALVWWLTPVPEVVPQKVSAPAAEKTWGEETISTRLPIPVRVTEDSGTPDDITQLAIASRQWSPEELSAAVEEAIAQAFAVPSSVEAVILLERMARTDGPATMNLLRQQPVARIYYQDLVLRAWARENPDQLVTWFRANQSWHDIPELILVALPGIENSQHYPELAAAHPEIAAAQLMKRQLAETTPAEALYSALAIEDADIRRDVAYNATSRTMAGDVESAFAVLENTADSELKQLLTSELIGKLDGRLADAEALLAEYGHLNPYVEPAVMKMLAANPTRDSFDRLTRYELESGDADPLYQMLASATLNDPETSLAWVETLDGELKTGALQAMRSFWFMKDQEGAIEYALASNDDEVRFHYLYHVGRRYPETATKLIDELPRGANRTVLVVGLARAQNDPEAAAAFMRENGEDELADMLSGMQGLEGAVTDYLKRLSN